VDFAADLDIIFQDGYLNTSSAGCGIIFVEASLSGSADHGELGVRALCGDVSYLVVGASGLTSGRGHREHSLSDVELTDEFRLVLFSLEIRVDHAFGSRRSQVFERNCLGLNIAILGLLGNDTALLDVYLEKGDFNTGHSRLLVEVGPLLSRSADHVEIISFAIDSNISHLHVFASGDTASCGLDKESLGNVDFSLEAEFVFTIFDVRADSALRFRSGLIDNSELFLLDFAVLGCLDDFAGNLEIRFEERNNRFTSASFSIEREEFHVRASHGEDISGALLGDISHFVVGFSGSSSGSSFEEGSHVQRALSSRARWVLSRFGIWVDLTDRWRNVEQVFEGDGLLLSLAIQSFLGNQTAHFDVSSELRNIYTCLTGRDIKFGEFLHRGADHVELIARALGNDVLHGHVGASRFSRASRGLDEESLGDVGFSLVAEFEFAILHVGVDRALTLGSCLVDNGDISLLNFAVFGGLDDVAGDLEISFKVRDSGFTSACLRVERQVSLVRAGHSEDISGALLSNVSYLTVGGTSSRSGSGGEEGGHVH